MITTLYAKYLKCSEITTDSRRVPSDSMFIALSGPTYNGNQFAQQALDQGAIYAVVDDVKYVLDDRYILVNDSLDTLQQLAMHHRDQMNYPVLAITGSNGKTTTKELCAAVLSTKLKIHYTQGNFNNHIGLPLTVLSAGLDLDLLIIEMGANHIGEIAALCAMGKPTHGLITNVGDAHLEGFGSLEGVVIGKTELYKYLRSHHGSIFINETDRQLMDHADGLNKIKYAHLGQVTTSNPNLEILLQDETQISTQLIGDYNLFNVLAALSVGLHFGISQDLAIQAIVAYQPSNNRSELRDQFGAKVIMDAYNANPSSMQVAIHNFSKLSGKKLAILGDMMELGNYEQTEHQLIAELALSNDIDQIIFVGQLFKLAAETHERILFVEHAHDAKKWLIEHSHQFDWILLKGSRKIQLEKIIED